MSSVTITGTAEGHIAAGTRINSDTFSFPPLTMAVTLRMARKTWHSLKPSSYARLLCFLALQRVRTRLCVRTCVGGGKKRARTPFRSRIPGIPLIPPPFLVSFLILFSSPLALLPYCGKRSAHFHSSSIHSFLPPSFVCSPKPGTRGSAGKSVRMKRSKTQVGGSTSQVDVCLIGVVWKREQTVHLFIH